MQSQHGSKIASHWVDPKSIEEAERRLIEAKGEIASIESTLGERKEAAGDRPGNEANLPDDYLEWRQRARRVLRRYRHERTNLLVWLQQHRAPDKLTRTLTPACVSCSMPLPQDRSSIYSDGWTRVRGAIDEQLYEAYQCPSCSEGVTADVRAYLTLTGGDEGEAPNADQHRARGVASGARTNRARST